MRATPSGSTPNPAAACDSKPFGAFYGLYAAKRGNHIIISGLGRLGFFVAALSRLCRVEGR
jgi:hypothetical protein